MKASFFKRVKSNQSQGPLPPAKKAPAKKAPTKKAPAKKAGNA